MVNSMHSKHTPSPGSSSLAQRRQADPYGQRHRNGWLESTGNSRFTLVFAVTTSSVLASRSTGTGDTPSCAAPSARRQGRRHRCPRRCRRGSTVRGRRCSGLRTTSLCHSHVMTFPQPYFFASSATSPAGIPWIEMYTRGTAYPATVTSSPFALTILARVRRCSRVSWCSTPHGHDRELNTGTSPDTLALPCTSGLRSQSQATSRGCASIACGDSTLAPYDFLRVRIQ